MRPDREVTFSVLFWVTTVAFVVGLGLSVYPSLFLDFTPPSTRPWRWPLDLVVEYWRFYLPGLFLMLPGLLIFGFGRRR